MVKEIQNRAKSFNYPLSSIYFGGGTPSLLTQDEIQLFLHEINKQFSVEDQLEITLEANPDDINPQKAMEWKTAGINRLSIGIQSFFEDNLQAMNRAHNREEAEQAIHIIRDAGFENFSVDLMFALPGLNNEMWVENLQKVINLKVPHLSCYNLTIEEQSALRKLIEKNKIPALSEQNSVEQFTLAMNLLQQAGYEQYEISNYCLPGKASRHNSAYWEGKPYLGIGPSAHSYYDNTRYHSIAHNQKYLSALEQNHPPVEKEILSAENQFNERILIQLRTSKGLNLALLEQDFPAYFQSCKPKIQSFIQNGKMEQINNDLRLSTEGKFLADYLASELFV